MPFDPSSATEVGGFDPSTATAFDPSTAKEEELSLWDKIAAHTDSKKSLKELALGPAGISGENVWKGVGHTLGIVSDEEYKKSHEQAKAAAQEHPIQSMIGQAGAIVAPTIAAGVMAPAVPLAAPMLAAGTLGAVMGGHESARLSPAGENATPLARLQATDLASDVGMMGVAAPAAVGRTLTQRVGTGAGINAVLGGGQRAIEHDIIHAERPDLAPEVFDPMAMGADLLLGGGAGLAVHATAPKGVGESAPPRPQERIEPTIGGEVVTPEAPTTPKHIELVTRQKNVLEGQLRAEEQKIASLEKDIAEKTYPSRALAQAAEETARVEIAARQENISKLESSIANATDIIENVQPAVFRSGRTDFPSSPPPRPEGESFVRPQQENITPIEEAPQTVAKIESTPSLSPIERTQPEAFIAAKQAEVTDAQAQEYLDLLDERKKLIPLVNGDFETPTPHLARLDEVNKRIDELSEMEVGDRAGTSVDIAPFTEALEAKGLTDPFAGEHPSYQAEEVKAAPAIEAMDDAEFAPAARTPDIKGGSSWIRGIAEEWIDKLGLSKEKSTIELGKTKEQFDAENIDGLGQTEVIGDNASRILVRGEESMRRALESDAALRSEVAKMTPEQTAKFKEAWTLAHELGHLQLAKLIQNHLWTDSMGLGNIIKGYDEWVAKNRDTARKQGTLMAKPRDPDYYLDFPEFFSQRTARELLFGNSSRHSAVSKFVKEIKEYWNAALKKIGVGRNNQVKIIDAFIKDLLAQNKKALEETGQTMFEIAALKDSNPTSLKEAWAWQAENLYKEKKGATDPVFAQDRTSQDFKERIQNATKALANVEQIKAQQTTLPDIAPASVKSATTTMKGLWQQGNMKFENMFFGIQNKAQFYRNSPAVKYAADLIVNTTNKVIERHNILLNGVPTYTEFKGRIKAGWTPISRIITGDSVTAVALKSSNEDFRVVHTLLEQNYGKKDYRATLTEDGAHLTPQQKTLFETLTKMYSKLENMANGVSRELGKKNPIPKVPGWYPSVRDHGNYSVNLYQKNVGVETHRLDNGTALFSDIIHRENFRTEAEAHDWLQRWESQSDKDKGDLTNTGVVENIKDDGADAELRQSFLRDFNVLADKVRESGGDVEAIQNMLNEQADWFIARGGSLGAHQQFRSNLSGYKGTELFKGKDELGQSFRDANFRAVDDFTRLMQKMEIEEKLNLITQDPELAKSHPNVVETVDSMKLYALNKEKGMYHMEGLQNLLDKVYTSMWKGAQKSAVGRGITSALGFPQYPKASVVQAAIGKTGHLFYIHALMGRPSFWLSQGIQSMWAMRTMAKDGVGPIEAMTHGGKATMNMVMPSEDYLKGLFWASQNRQVFHPSFISELNSFHIADFLKEGGKGKMVVDLITGEKQSTAADTFSRLMTYSLMYEHFKSRGLKGIELYDTAAKATDENMVQYGPQFKPPIFRKLGVVGDVISPLTTFSQAALGNLLADAKTIAEAPGGKAKLVASAPFLTTFMITAIMTGALGSVFMAETEVVRRGLNMLLPDDMQIPSLIDLALSGDNTFSHRMMSHGLVSASTLAVTDEGLDLGSGNRFNDIFIGLLTGEKTFLEAMPVISFAASTTSNVASILGPKTLTDTERRNAAMDLTPGMYKGFTDMAKFDSMNRKMVPDRMGNAVVPQTKTEILAQFLGTQTLNASTTKFRIRRLDEEFKKKNAKASHIRELMFDAAVNGKPEQANEYLKKLSTEYKVSGDAVMQYLASEAGRRYVPQEMRMMMDADSASGANKFMEYQQTYGNPLMMENAE